MKKLTDYKYRQLRAMVQRAKVRKSVKELLSCTLRDYKNEASAPVDGAFQEGKKRCLIGAAVHNIGLHTSLENDGYDWEKIAVREFGITPDEAQEIINGFDNTPHNENGDVSFASQLLAQEFGKGNRVAFLANRLRRELLPSE